MRAGTKDYYEVLGVKRDATFLEIRHSFRKLARQYHPDLATDKLLAEEMFKEINEAYEVLSNPKMKREYDRYFAVEGLWRAHREARGPKKESTREDRGRGSEKTDFRPYTEEPQFRSYYDRFAGGARGFADGSYSRTGHEDNEHRQKRRRPERGRNIEGELLVTLEEVLNGAVRVLTLGHERGENHELERVSLRVRINPGVQDGDILRFRTQGHTGDYGGAPGDLYVKVRYAPHKVFRVAGSDLTCELELAPWEALFGGKKQVQTLEGMAAVRIPPGTVARQRLRLRGKGLPDSLGRRGDLYVTIRVRGRLSGLVTALFRR